MASEVVFVRDGTYEGEAMVVLEKRDGKYAYVWHGYFDGGNLLKLYPKRPWGGLYDGRVRKPMVRSIYEIGRDTH